MQDVEDIKCFVFADGGRETEISRSTSKYLEEKIPRLRDFKWLSHFQKFGVSTNIWSPNLCVNLRMSGMREI